MPAQQSASGLDVNEKKLLNPNVIAVSTPSNSEEVNCEADQAGGDLKITDKDLHNLEKIKAELDSLTPSLPNSDAPAPSSVRSEEAADQHVQKDAAPATFTIKAIKTEKDDSGRSACPFSAKPSSVCITASAPTPSTTVTTTVPASASGSVSLVTAAAAPDGSLLAAAGGTAQFLPISVLGVSSPVTKGGKHVLIVQKTGATTGQFTTAAVSTLAKTTVLPAYATTPTGTLVAQQANASTVTSKPVTITVPTTAIFQGSTSAVNNISLASVKGSDVKVIMPENIITQSTVVTVPEPSQTSSTSTTQTVLKRPVTCTSGAQMITKVIITNNPLTNQPTANPVALSSSTAASIQSVGIVPGTSQPVPIQQAPTVLLASPTKAFSIPKSNVGTVSGHQILRALPGTPPKQGIFVLSPVKNSGKVAMIPLKSPHRIAPAPTTAIETSSGSKVTIVTATAAGAASTGSKPIAIQASPTKVILKPAIPFTVKAPIMTASLASQASTTNAPLSTSVTTVSASSVAKTIVTPATTATTAGVNAVRQIHVPGSRFQYVRLVTAVSQPNIVAGNKQAPAAAATVVTSTRPLAPAVSTATTTTQSVTTSTVNPPTTASGQVSLTIPIAPAVSGQPPIQLSAKPAGTTAQRLLFPASAVTSVNQIRATSAVPPSALGQFPAGTLISAGSNVQGIVMVPAQYVTQQQPSGQGTRIMIQAAQPQSILPTPSPASGTTTTAVPQTNFVPIVAASTVSRSYEQQQVQQPPPMPPTRHQTNGLSAESGDTRPRKPCNCTKSQCLKLYCDCFANGEFCNCCNCTNCFNNLEHEEERQRAIKACLDRNPHAFHPKIGKSRSNDQERRHMKGCNCKRSGCLKNYCECYEAKILCTNLCKCVGCKNFEDSSERKTLMHLADAAEVRVQQQTAAKTKISSQIQDFPSRPPIISTTGERLPCAFITQPVVESACQCLLAQAENGERSGHPVKKMERLVLEEFGRCLMQIIEYANKTKVSTPET